MAYVSVDLSPDLQQHLDDRAADGGMNDAGAYLRALAEQDRAAYRADVARVGALIDEGLASGVCEKDAFQVIDEIISGLRRSNG